MGSGDGRDRLVAGRRFGFLCDVCGCLLPDSFTIGVVVASTVQPLVSGYVFPHTGHVWLVCVALGVSAVWMVIGWEMVSAFHGWERLLVVLPSLAVYGLGVGYVYFFGLRNETVYLRKKDLQRCPPPELSYLLRTYLPAFGWCDSLLCFLSLLYVLGLERKWVSEEYEKAVLLVFALVYTWASWRLMRMGRVFDRCGSRSYPMTLLEISGLLLMVTPMAVHSAQYAEAVLCQLFALTGYLNAFYFYEQKKKENEWRQ